MNRDMFDFFFPLLKNSFETSPIKCLCSRESFSPVSKFLWTTSGPASLLWLWLGEEIKSVVVSAMWQCRSRPASPVAHSRNPGQLCFLVIIDMGNLSAAVPGLLFVDGFHSDRGVQKWDILGRRGGDDVRPWEQGWGYFMLCTYKGKWGGTGFLAQSVPRGGFGNIAVGWEGI